jgi:hypothetical protein
MSHLRISNSNGDITIACEGFQNLDLCLVLRTFKPENDLYHATPAVTLGISFSGLTWRTIQDSFTSYNTQGMLRGPILTQILMGRHSVTFYNMQRDAEDLFSSRSSRVPIQSILITRKGMLRTYSYPEPHGSPFSHLLRHTRGCWGPILTQSLTGPHSVTSYDTQGDAEDLFLPWTSRVPIQSPLTTHKGMLTKIKHIRKTGTYIWSVVYKPSVWAGYIGESWFKSQDWLIFYLMLHFDRTQCGPFLT